MGSRAKHLLVVACFAVGLSLVVWLLVPKPPSAADSTSEAGLAQFQQAERARSRTLRVRVLSPNGVSGARAAVAIFPREPRATSPIRCVAARVGDVVELELLLEELDLEYAGRLIALAGDDTGWSGPKAIDLNHESERTHELQIAREWSRVRLAFDAGWDARGTRLLVAESDRLRASPPYPAAQSEQSLDAAVREVLLQLGPGMLVGPSHSSGAWTMEGPPAELFVRPGDEVELAGSWRSRFVLSFTREDADRRQTDEWAIIARPGLRYSVQAPSGQRESLGVRVLADEGAGPRFLEASSMDLQLEQIGGARGRSIEADWSASIDDGTAVAKFSVSRGASYELLASDGPRRIPIARCLFEVDHSGGVNVIEGSARVSGAEGSACLTILGGQLRLLDVGAVQRIAGQGPPRGVVMRLDRLGTPQPFAQEQSWTWFWSAVSEHYMSFESGEDESGRIAAYVDDSMELEIRDQAQVANVIRLPVKVCFHPFGE